MENNSPKKYTRRQRLLIDKHNHEMDIIAEASRQTGLSQCTLYFAAQFGIMGIGWNEYEKDLMVTNPQPNGSL